MRKQLWIGLAGLASFLMGSAGAWAYPQSGYYVSHQEAADRGGVGNYVPQHYGHHLYTSGNKIGFTDTTPASKQEAGTVAGNQYSMDTGRYVDHNTAVALGGVGNYISNSEAKQHDDEIANSENLRRQVASTDSSGKPVAEVSPDEGVVFFNTGDAKLTSDGKAEIASIANELKQDPSLNVEVNGFTDAKGDASLNQQLSAERANTVKDALLRKGVKPSQVRTQAFGESQPIATNDTEPGRAVNRRAEIYIETG